MAINRDEFENVSGTILGAVTIDRQGAPRGVAVAPGDRVWLSEEEQVLTANAPRDPADNPLANGNFALRNEGQSITSSRSLRPTPQEEQSEEGSDEDQAGDSTEGSASEPQTESAVQQTNEEVGTPQARRRGRPRKNQG